MPRRALFLQYTNPGGLPVLQHAARILLDDGWAVTFLGCAAEGDAACLHLAQHPRMAVHLMSRQAPGWRQKLHFMAYAAWALMWRLAWRPHCIYASDALAAPAALAAASLPVRCVIYHEHDAPPPPPGRFAHAIHALRRRLVRAATLAVVPNASRGEALLETTGLDRTRLACVWNCPALNEVGPARAPSAGGDFWLLFHGSIVPDRLPVTLLDALAHVAPRIKLRVVGYETAGSRGYVGELREHARLLGLGDRVQFLGTLPHRDEMLAVTRSCDVGVSLMPMDSADANMRHMTGASQKPFEYMASGCALLVSDLPDWVAMFVTCGFGLSCDPRSPASIAAAIRRLSDDTQGTRQMGERGRRAILDRLHYEKCFDPVLTAIRRATGTT